MGDPSPEEVALEQAQAAFNAALASLPMPGPLAARISDPHLCPLVDGVKPHVGGPVAKGQPNVMIGGMPAARVTDTCVCASAPDMIAKGSMSVFIGGMPAARMMDQTAHGGVISMGCPTVFIGDMGGGPAPSSFQAAAANGTPLVCKGTCPECGQM